MRKTFPGYYRPTKEEFANLWHQCIFAFDANVLLNLYRYSSETSLKLLNILENIGDRLWIPHQAALDYQKNRLIVISKQEEAYDELINHVNELQNKIVNTLNTYLRHPILKLEVAIDKVKDTLSAIKEEIDERRREHPDLFNKDIVRNKISSLFEGKVGHPYSREEIKKIFEEGENRYSRRFPPGYEDVKKVGDERYGDLILWYQVIDKAKEEQRPVILVTDENKEDWWLKFKGKTIGPRPELVEEILSKSGVSFYMYQSDQFMRYAREYLNQEVEAKTIVEVSEIRKQHVNISIHTMDKEEYLAHELFSLKMRLNSFKELYDKLEDKVLITFDEDKLRILEAEKESLSVHIDEIMKEILQKIEKFEHLRMQTLFQKLKNVEPIDKK